MNLFSKMSDLKPEEISFSNRITIILAGTGIAATVALSPLAHTNAYEVNTPYYGEAAAAAYVDVHSAYSN